MRDRGERREVKRKIGRMRQRGGNREGEIEREVIEREEIERR